MVVLTGAGVSAESGIPTFRGPDGLWRNHRPQDLATPDAFARDPRLVWEWYDWRRQRIAEARPNPGHEALARLESRLHDFLLVTQNVDGLHRRAGSRNVVELHGNIWKIRCSRCGAEREDRTAPLAEVPPRCSCGGFGRPGVVWFGEALPEGAMEQAASALETADLFLMIGTSAVVWPAAGLGELALRRDIPVIEINPEPTSYSERVLSLRGKAGEVLPAIVAD